MAKWAKRDQLSQDRQIKALKPASAVYEHAIKGCSGLRIRVAITGRKYWYYRYRNRHTGKLQLIRLGEYAQTLEAHMGLADARAELERYRHINKEHGSAKDYRDRQRAANRAKLAIEQAEEQRSQYSVGKMIEDYLADGDTRNLASWGEKARALRKYVLPGLGSLSVFDISRRDVRDALSWLKEEDKNVQYNRVWAYLRAAFNWAISREQEKSKTERRDFDNPLHGVKLSKEGVKRRYLSEVEIKRFLRNLAETGIDPTIADVYRLILLTGLRSGEAVSVSFENVDLEAKTLLIPSTKSGRPHRVPLSAPALRLIERRREVNAGKWLFPAVKNKNNPIRVDALQAPLREAMPKLKVLPFTPHDLRRTFATGLARRPIQASRLLISLALNHRVKGVTDQYDRHSYDDELREVFESWGNRVDALEAGESEGTEQKAA